MDELGVDFVVIYPTQGLGMTGFRDEELRRVACRAFNTFHAEIFRSYARWMTPVAVIPMDTPQEAIEELEYAVNVLGLRAMTFSLVRRPIPSIHRTHPQFDRMAHRLETFGIDSDYDYDPFWARCVELKVAAASHSGSSGWGSRRSISNFMYNSTGHFAAASDALCKSLFMGGVTRRFPKLNFAFLEGGVAWAAQLYSDMVSRWQKRNPSALEDLDPANLDLDLMAQLVAQYGEGKILSNRVAVGTTFALEQQQPRPILLDEWDPCQIENAEDIQELFVPRFFFGCEGGDPLVPLAFNARMLPFGARLNALFGSDIGHWDIPDMREVVPEAFGLVEAGLLTPEDFCDFTFGNSVNFYAGTNRDFFKGTAIESEVDKFLANV